MRFSIFSRLFIGFTVIFVLLAVVGVYGIYRLYELSGVTRSILINNRMLALSDKLTDAVLSEIRYEKKFVFIKDDSLYGHFLLAKGDFDQSLRQIEEEAQSPEIKELISGIRDSHQRYHGLFDEEVGRVRAAETYSEEDFKKRKEEAVDTVMAGVKDLQNRIKRNTYSRIEELGAAGTVTLKVTIVLTLTAILAGIVISWALTRSITRPLGVLKKKTSEIAAGDFDSAVTVSSPPEIKELARAFNIMCGKLKEVDRMKSDFFSLMSHELRTPLTSLREGTNLLLTGAGGQINEKQARILTIMSEESDRMIGLVNSILDLSKMEAGMMTFNFARADIGRLVKKVATELEPLSEAKKINLDVDVSPELSEVEMDSDRILQALRNLASNAVKYTPAGGRVRIAARQVEGGVEIAVSDTGAGIPNGDLSIIFDKFKQTTLAGVKQIRGTGLGLALVKQIISAHGGKVWAESEPGQGSTFFFVLPS
ncbi:MAG: hypothetical protein Kow0025_16770 [Thermodesulfovibrionales bacterium]